MDIYHYLMKDHRKVAELMDQVISARSPVRRSKLFQDIRDELTLHADTEQATFYAVLENNHSTSEKIEEAESDHAEIKEYLAKLSSISPESSRWLEVFGEFKHAVEHHVQDEENRIFMKARQIITADEAVRLTADMKRLKEEKLRRAA